MWLQLLLSPLVGAIAVGTLAWDQKAQDQGISIPLAAGAGVVMGLIAGLFLCWNDLQVRRALVSQQAPPQWTKKRIGITVGIFLLLSNIVGCTGIILWDLIARRK